MNNTNTIDTMNELIDQYGESHQAVLFSKALMGYHSSYVLETLMVMGYNSTDCEQWNITPQQWNDAASTAANENSQRGY